MNLSVMPGWLMVRPLLPETKTKIGIELPPDAVEKPPSGEVVELGSFILNKNESYEFPKIEKGSKVYFQRWGGLLMKIDGVSYMFLQYKDLIAVENK